MNQAIIGLGSNISPEDHIERALIEIEKIHPIIKRSNFVITQPIGIKEQAPFLNGAILINCLESNATLIQRLKSIEDRLARDRSTDRNGPRNIDLDLLLWNGEVCDPDVYSREFLRKAITEITGQPVIKPVPGTPNS